MKIRNRFTLISSFTFSVVFVIASIITYLSFYSYSEKIIFNELQKTCLLTGIFYLEKDELTGESAFDYWTAIQGKFT
jgi:two-component system sensor histidine kinase ArlS